RQIGSHSVLPDVAVGTSRSNSMPASEVIRPPSKRATTRRPPTPWKTSCSSVQSMRTAPLLLLEVLCRSQNCLANIAGGAIFYGEQCMLDYILDSHASPMFRCQHTQRA